MGAGWEVRDLGSRNGTFVQGERLAPGARAKLNQGGQVAFGDLAHTFVLTDGTAPGAMALPEGGGLPVVSEEGMLVLPDVDNPVATVYLDAQCRWVIERDGQAQAALSGAVVEVGERRWTLVLPEPVEGTLEAAGAALDVLTPQTMVLDFEVSLDEETVGINMSVETAAFRSPGGCTTTCCSPSRGSGSRTLSTRPSVPSTTAGSMSTAFSRCSG